MDGVIRRKFWWWRPLLCLNCFRRSFSSRKGGHQSKPVSLHASLFALRCLWRHQIAGPPSQCHTAPKISSGWNPPACLNTCVWHAFCWPPQSIPFVDQQAHGVLVAERVDETSLGDFMNSSLWQEWFILHQKLQQLQGIFGIVLVCFTIGNIILTLGMIFIRSGFWINDCICTKCILISSVRWAFSLCSTKPLSEPILTCWDLGPKFCKSKTTMLGTFSIKLIAIYFQASGVTRHNQDGCVQAVNPLQWSPLQMKLSIWKKQHNYTT